MANHEPADVVSSHCSETRELPARETLASSSFSQRLIDVVASLLRDTHDRKRKRVVKDGNAGKNMEKFNGDEEFN